MLRHACGFKLANDGHDTRALRAYLGHKNIQHTVRYAELSEGFLARLNEQEPPAAYASCQLEPSTHGPFRCNAMICRFRGDFVAEVRCRLFWSVIPSL